MRVSCSPERVRAVTPVVEHEPTFGPHRAQEIRAVADDEGHNRGGPATDIKAHDRAWIDQANVERAKVHRRRRDAERVLADGTGLYRGVVWPSDGRAKSNS